MRASLWTIAIFLVACGRSDEPAAASETAVTAVPPAAAVEARRPSTSVQTGDPCPATGLWAPCSVEKRLERAGFVLRKIEEEAPKRPGFSVEPVVYSLGRGRLEIFVYANDAALAKDLGAMDTTTVAPKGSTGTWPSAPSLVRSGNLAAVYMDQSQRQSERLVLAITAGAPSGR